MLITDLTHFLAPNGSIGPKDGPARRLAWLPHKDRRCNNDINSTAIRINRRALSEAAQSKTMRVGNRDRYWPRDETDHLVLSGVWGTGLNQSLARFAMGLHEQRPIALMNRPG